MKERDSNASKTILLYRKLGIFHIKKAHRDTVDAITVPHRLGSVVEDVAKVTFASTTTNLTTRTCDP